MVLAQSQYCINQLGHRGKLEDSIYPEPGSTAEGNRLFIVADGVGGRLFGEVASKFACSVLPKAFLEVIGQTQDFRLALEAGWRVAQTAMKDYEDKSGKRAGMMTTLTLAWLEESQVRVAWCGDSRIYHIRGGRILWKSKDHSFVQDLVDAGTITEDEARTHESRNIITRALSKNAAFEDVDTHILTDIKTDDWLMLCTDGILEHWADKDLRRLFADPGRDPYKEIKWRGDSGTSDNYSMYLLRLDVRQ